MKNKILDQNHDKFVTTQKSNKLTSEKFAVRLTQAKLIPKGDFVHLVKNIVWWCT